MQPVEMISLPLLHLYFEVHPLVLYIHSSYHIRVPALNRDVMEINVL